MTSCDFVVAVVVLNFSCAAHRAIGGEGEGGGGCGGNDNSFFSGAVAAATTSAIWVVAFQLIGMGGGRSSCCG